MTDAGMRKRSCGLFEEWQAVSEVDVGPLWPFDCLIGRLDTMDAGRHAVVSRVQLIQHAERLPATAL